MDVVENALSCKEWTQAAESLPGYSLLQSWEYGEAKAQVSSWKVDRFAFLNGGRIVGLAQALVRRIPLFGGVAWINRGPLIIASNSQSFYETQVQILRRYYVEENGMYLRFAPPEGTETDRFDAASLGATRCSRQGMASARLNLDLPCEELKHGLKEPWRRSLRRAESAGIVVRSDSENGEFCAFLGGYEEFLARREFRTTVTPALLAALQSLLPKERKMLAFTARKDGELLGSMLFVRYGSTCEYLAGYVVGIGRRLRAGQLLMWSAVCRMKDLGMKRFDLGGFDPLRSTKGIMQFKSGLGAEPYRSPNEIEAYRPGIASRLLRWQVEQALGV